MSKTATLLNSGNPTWFSSTDILTKHARRKGFTSARGVTPSHLPTLRVHHPYFPLPARPQDSLRPHSLSPTCESLLSRASAGNRHHFYTYPTAATLVRCSSVCSEQPTCSRYTTASSAHDSDASHNVTRTSCLPLARLLPALSYTNVCQRCSQHPLHQNPPDVTHMSSLPGSEKSRGGLW